VSGSASCKIFLSDRRADAGGYAGWLHQRGERAPLQAFINYRRRDTRWDARSLHASAAEHWCRERARMMCIARRVFSLGWRAAASGVLAMAIVCLGSSVPALALVRSGVKSLVRAGVKPLHTPLLFYALKSQTLTVRSNAVNGAISPHPTVYLVFWGSQWSNDPSNAAPELSDFFVGLHGELDRYDAVLTQYCEGVPAGTARCGARGRHVAVPTSSVLAGTWFDRASDAPEHATDAQFVSETEKAARYFGNVTQQPNLNAQYWLASPSGTHPDGFNTLAGDFCGWHSSARTKYGQLAYVNLPYIPDLGRGGCTTLNPAEPLDGYFSTATHEYGEIVTDFWPDSGWIKKNREETADECISLDARLTLSTGTYDFQGLWSNLANECVTSAQASTSLAAAWFLNGERRLGDGTASTGAGPK
jgi:hypothetical protein